MSSSLDYIYCEGANETYNGKNDRAGTTEGETGSRAVGDYVAGSFHAWLEAGAGRSKGDGMIANHAIALILLISALAVACQSHWEKRRR